MVALELRRVSKRFGDAIALDDLSFEVGEGSVTGFLGPNGAGKTTSIRILTGLLRPTSGVALITGVTYESLPHPIRSLGLALEPNGFHPARSARDHLAQVARAAGVSLQRVDELLDRVGLTQAANRRVRGFSLGMRQRLSLATALVGDPQILIADEPSNGLDPQGIHWVRDFLRSLAKEGRTVFVSSHQLAELALVAERVVIIDKGRLIREGRIDQLSTRGHHVVIRTPSLDLLETAMTQAGVAVTRTADDEIIVDADADTVGALVAASGVVVYEMRSEKPTLEETFLNLTTEGHRS